MAQRPENDPLEARAPKVSEFGRAFATALVAGDEIAAEVVIREAMDAGLGTATIDDEIITPALWLVGDLWARGEISVADEHLATEISLRVLALQREAQRVADQRRGRRVLVAATSGEHHVVALRMVANLLREAAYDVVMLGGDVPAGALAAAASRHDPHVVCMGATMPGGADRLLLAIHAVQQEWPGTAFVVGGRALTSRVQPQPRLEICRSVAEVVPAVDALIQRANLN
jgi:MerR family transcriptional regulator, light-induced transcriptional regulator